MNMLVLKYCKIFVLELKSRLIKILRSNIKFKLSYFVAVNLVFSVSDLIAK